MAAELEEKDRVYIPREFWKIAAETVNRIRPVLLVNDVSITGVVKWIGTLADTTVGAEPQQMFGVIEADVCISTSEDSVSGCFDTTPYFNCREGFSVILPVEFLAAHVKKALNGTEGAAPLEHYQMNSSPHGIALVIVNKVSDENQFRSNVEESKFFSKEFEHLRYLVHTYICENNEQLDDVAAQISALDFSSFDSFICYIAPGEMSSKVYQLINQVGRCPSLEEKPKVFFINSCWDPQYKVGSDVFIMWAGQKAGIDVVGNAFPLAFRNVFFAESRNFDLFSMSLKVSAISSMCASTTDEIAGQCCKVVSSLKKNIYFFPNEKLPSTASLKNEETVRVRWSHVTLTGLPGSGSSSFLQRLFSEPLLKGHSTRIFARPEVTTVCCTASQDHTRPWTKLYDISLAQMSDQPVPVHHVRIINSGGHPAFLLHGLGLFRSNSVNFFVQKLNEELSQAAMYNFCVENEHFSAPLRCLNTSLDIFESLCRSLSSADLPQLSLNCSYKEIINPTLLMLGTFLDKSSECQESLDEKKAKVIKVLKSFKRLLYSRNPVFTINALSNEKEVFESLRAKILNSYIEMDVPFRWSVFHDNLQKSTNSNIVSKMDCVLIGQNLNMDRSEVEAALMYYRDLTIFLYFPSILPDVVFLHPQPLLDKLSELIGFSFHDYCDLSFITQDQLEFSGTFSHNLLAHLSSGFSSIFTEDDFLALMNHLSIIMYLPEKKFFFPSVLPIAVLADQRDRLKNMSTPLILTWNMETIPQSLFFQLIVHLLLRSSSPRFSFLEASDESQQYCNAVFLSCPDFGGSLIILDAVHWLEIYYTGASRRCLAIKDTVLEVTAEIFEKYQYKLLISQPQLAFHCSIHQASDHLCRPSENLLTLTCLDDGISTGEMSYDHEVWFTAEINDKGFMSALKAGLSECRVKVKWTKVIVSGAPHTGESEVMKLLLGRSSVTHSTMLEMNEVESIDMVATCANEDSWEIIDYEAYRNEIFQKLNAKKASSTETSLSFQLHLMNVINSKGHVSFLHLAPALMGCYSVNVIPLNLSQSLSDEVELSYYTEGEKVTFGGQMTNLQFIQESFRSLAFVQPFRPFGISAECSHDKSRFLILGTNAEKMTSEESGRNNDVLSESLRNYIDMVLYFSQGTQELIFPLTEFSADNPETKQILSRYFIETEVPARWILLYLKLCQVHKSDKLYIIQMKECLRIAKEELSMEKSEVEAALKFYHDLTIFQYFPSVLPDIVFLHPQPILDKLSELISISSLDVIKVLETKGVYIPYEMHHKMLTKGVFNRDLLAHYFTNRFTKSFSPDDFLKLMESLHVVASLPTPNEYFIPSALPIATVSEEATEPFSKNIDPLILTFGRKPIPKTLFLSLVVNLLRISSCSFEIPESRDILQSRNCVRLFARSFGGSLVLIDQVFWFEMYYSGPSDNASMITSVVIEEISNLILSQFDYAFNIKALQKVFYCSYHRTRDHFCIPNEYNSLVTCSEDLASTMHIDKSRQLPWLSKSNIERAYTLEPSLLDLTHHLSPIAYQWREIGISLNLPSNDLSSVQFSHQSNTAKLSTVLKLWLEKVPTPVTWQTILDVASGPIVNNRRLRAEIEHYLCSSVSPHSDDSSKGAVSVGILPKSLPFTDKELISCSRHLVDNLEDIAGLLDISEEYFEFIQAQSSKSKITQGKKLLKKWQEDNPESTRQDLIDVLEALGLTKAVESLSPSK